MKIFFSNGWSYMTKFSRENELHELGVKNRLYSYLHLQDKKYKDVFDQVFEKNFYDVMIDSGAFTVASRGLKVDIDDYAKFINDLSSNPSLFCYVNLDVIPYFTGDNINALPSTERFDVSAQEGWENLVYLTKKCPHAKPVHCFHTGENIKWLKKLIDNYDYFGLSKSKLANSDEGFAWLDECWKLLTDDNGKPIRKVHGFALTSPTSMFRYPWYSVDSSSWSLTGVYGRVLFFKEIKNVNDPIKFSGVYMSKYNPKKKVKGAHYDTLSKHEQDEIDRYFESIGMSSKELLEEESHTAKNIANIKFYFKLEELISNIDWKPKGLQKGFFD